MAAGRIVVPPYFPARNRDFDLLSGAKLYVYTNLTTEKASIYIDEALTVLSANPVIANSSGQFPAVYAEAGTEASPVLYRVSVTTSTGASPGNPFTFDNYRPSVDWETAAAALAEAAAAAAEADAVQTAADVVLTAANAAQTTADLAAIEAIIADAPEAPSILNKANLNGDNITGANIAAFRAAIAAVGTATLSAPNGSSGVGWNAGVTGDVDRTVESKLRDFRSFEDFGAVGDYDSGTGTGTDDTLAIQAAFDWAFSGGTVAARAILMTAKNFLCGNLITYPTTCIIGTGSHTSAFWCKTGTTGRFITDNGSAAKTNLSGFTIYGRNNTAVTAGIDLGNNGVQFGTEGLLRDIIVRDFPNAYGWNVNGNVGRFQNLTGQSCRTNMRITGDANKLFCIESMQAGQGSTGAIAGGPVNVRGLDLSGCVGDQFEIEATTSGGLPLRMTGDCQIDKYLISSANGTTFSHLVEVDTTTYNHFSLTNPTMFVTGSVTVTNGIVKVGALYQGGTSPTAFSGKSILSALNIETGALRMRDALYQAITVQLYNDAGTIKHRIGSLADASLAGTYCTKISGSSTSFTTTPTGAAAFSAGASLLASGGQLALNTTNAQAEATQTVQGTITLNDSGTALDVALLVYDATVNGVTAKRIVIEYRVAATGAIYNVASTLPVGKFISVGFTGFIF